MTVGAVCPVLVAAVAFDPEELIDLGRTYAKWVTTFGNTSVTAPAGG